MQHSNIPITGTINIIELKMVNKIQTHNINKNTIETIIEQIYFTYNYTTYKTNNGLIMGSPIIAIISTKFNN